MLANVADRPTLPNGLFVALQGLAAKPELNGQHGVVRGWNPNSGRHAVELADGKQILLKPENLEPSLRQAAQFRMILTLTPDALAAHPQCAQIEKVRASLLATPHFVEALRAPENSEEAAMRYEWKVVGATACIVNSAKRPELSGLECEIRSVGQAGVHSVRVCKSGELVRIEEDSLARPGSALAVRAASAPRPVHLGSDGEIAAQPATASRSAEDEKEDDMTRAQIMHSDNCLKLVEYVERKGHWVCRLDGAGGCAVAQVVKGGKKAGPPKPSEFAFSSSGQGDAFTPGSFHRLNAAQTNYVPNLLIDAFKLYNQQKEERVMARKAEEEQAAAAAAAAAEAAAEAEAKAKAEAEAERRRRKEIKAAVNAERLRGEREAEAELVTRRAEQEAARLEEARRQVEKEEKHAEGLRRAEWKRRRAVKLEEERAAAAVRAERRKVATKKMEERAAANAAAVEEFVAAQEAKVTRDAAGARARAAHGGGYDRDGDSDASNDDDDADALDEAAAAKEATEAQVLADSEMAKMLSQMDDEKGEWHLAEKRRRATGREALDMAAAWANEVDGNLSKGGVALRSEELTQRRAHRAAKRVLERLNRVVHEGAQGSDDTTRRATMRAMLAESASADNDGEPVSEELMRAIEVRVAGLVRKGLDHKEAAKINGPLHSAESFADCMRVWKTVKSWPALSLSYLWSRLARWAKEERRVGREALGDELERLLDETLSVLVAMSKDSQGHAPGARARTLSVLIASAAKLDLRPENSQREAALFSVVDEGFVQVMRAGSLHHVATAMWAYGKAGATNASLWPLAERLLLQRGLAGFNEGLSFHESNKFTDQSMTMVNLSMVMTGLANALRPCDELCARVAAELPALFGQLRKLPDLSDDHVAIVNVAHAFAKLGYVDEHAFHELGRAARLAVPLFSTQQVSNTAWAFARAGVPATELFGAMALHAVPRANDFSEQGVSMTLWAYATAGVPAPNLFATFAKVARHRIQAYTEQGLVNTLWSFGKAGVDAPELFEAALRCALPRVGTYAAEHVSQLLQALSSSTFRSPTVAKFVTALCEKQPLIQRVVEFGDAQCCVVTIHSLASLGHPVPGPLAAQLLHALLKKQPDPRHLAQFAWALVTSADAGGVGGALGGLLDLLSTRAIASARAFANKDCAILPWSLWKGCCEHGKGFTPVAKECVLALASHATVKEFSHHDLSNLATVFHHCPELSSNLPGMARQMAEEVHGRMDMLHAQHFGVCVRFLATCQAGTPELWADIEAAWLRRHRTFEPQATVSLIWAVGTAGATALRLHSVLGSSDTLARMLECPSAQWLANLSWGCAVSEVGLPSLFGPVCDAAAALLRRSPKGFKLAELSTLLWAVATSGYHVHPRAKAVFETAIDYLTRCDMGECDGQSVCNLLWAWAVADMREHRAPLRQLHAHFLSLLQRGRLDRRGMSQAHQYQLWVQLELKDEALLFEPSIRRRCREAMELTHKSITVSGFQQHVARVLRELDVSYQLEHNLHGYSVDLALLSARVALEVDGPHHFMYNFAPGKDSQTIDNAKTKVVAVNGASMLKERIMSALGWRTVSVPFFEFELMQNPYDPTAVTAEHKRYLSAKLSAAKK